MFRIQNTLLFMMIKKAELYDIFPFKKTKKLSLINR